MYLHEEFEFIFFFLVFFVFEKGSMKMGCKGEQL